MASLRIEDGGIGEPSLFVQESPISFSRSDPSKHVRPTTETTKNSDQPLETDARWKHPFGDLLQQCIHKEKAAETGVQCLNHLIATLKAHDDPSLTRICQLWIGRIETILADKETVPVYIGFIGGTGAGKSTLINALLKIKGLLPTDSLKACTAVVVEVSYNRSDDKDALYRAEVEFVSHDDWRNELRVLFADLSDHYSTSGGGDGQQDELRQERINEAFAAVKVVYPQLTSIANLRATSISELMDDEKVRSIIGSTKKIQNGKLSNFTRAIRPYIATSDSDKVKLDYWPLIKCVKLFVKVPFLQSGIVLVDLPGNMDRNSARGAIAMNYLKKLAAPLIVANAMRGIDDKNAHLILEDVMKTDLQMDGVYNANNLCFILSQFDRDYDIKDYLEHDDNLRKSLRLDFKKARELGKTLAERRNELAETQKSREGHKRSIEEIEAQIEHAKAQSGQVTKSGAELQLKRKRGTGNDNSDSNLPPTSTITSLRKQVAALKETAGKEADKIDSLIRSIKSLTNAVKCNNSLIHEACHKNRKAKATAAVRKDFENNLREMGKTGSDKTLHVFCTASAVYLDYLKMEELDNGKKTLGFPDQQSTEVPGLRDWLVKFTLPSREAKAQALLEDIERLVTSMKPWIEDRSGDIKMSSIERAKREQILEDRVKELEQNISQLGIKTIETMEQLGKAGVYNRMPEVELTAAKMCQETVAVWGKELWWNTHRAVNQRSGEWIDVKNGKNHIWNDKLAQVYKDRLTNPWNRIFHETFPEEIASYAREEKQLIVEFALNTTHLGLFPEHAMALELLKDQVLKTSNLAFVKSQKISEAIEKKIKNSHRLAPPVIKDFLKPMYAHCATQGGADHFKRNRVYHQEHMKKYGAKMYHEVSEVIRIALDELFEDLPRSFEAVSAEILTQIRREIAIFFEQNSSVGTRTSSKRTISLSKIKLQNTLDTGVGHLIKAWNENVDFKAEEVFDMSSLEFGNDGRFSISEVLRDGDYDPDGSDEDDF